MVGCCCTASMEVKNDSVINDFATYYHSFIHSFVLLLQFYLLVGVFMEKYIFAVNFLCFLFLFKRCFLYWKTSWGAMMSSILRSIFTTCVARRS